MLECQYMIIAMIMFASGVLVHYLIERLVERRLRASTQCDAQANPSHELVSLEQEPVSQSDIEDLATAASAMPTANGICADFEILTSKDVVIGYFVIREWVFSKYKLNQREKEIARMVLDGITNSQIAVKARLAESSVKYHITSIFRKTSQKNRKDFGALVRREMNKSTRQWSSRSELLNELALIRGKRA